MALKKKPVTGMKDILPKEMEIRNYVMNMIRETYKTFGFCAIETPCVEHIENLCSKQGGENEKLIFKILKRGEKLCPLFKSFKSVLTFTPLEWKLMILGSVVAFVVAYIVIKWFMRYIKTRTFKLFGVYRIILGILVLIILK